MAGRNLFADDAPGRNLLGPEEQERTTGSLGPSGATFGPFDAFGSAFFQGMGDEMKAFGAALKESLSGGLDFDEAFEQAQTMFQEERRKFREENPAMAPVVEAGGAAAPFLMAAPFAPAMGLLGATATGAGAGALSGGLQAEGDLGDRLEGAALGAGIGAAVPPALAGLGRVVAPVGNAAAQRLRSAGITPTIGQMAGGAARRVEEGLKSIPFVGDAVRSAERRAIEDFNRVTINRALSNIGRSLPDDVPVGRAAVQEATEQVSKAFDDIVPSLQASIDEPFVNQMQSLRSLTEEMLPARQQQFMKIIQEQVVRKIPPSGVITGQTFKEAESGLGRLATKFRGSADADQRLLGDALQEAQAVLRDLLQRQNPQVAQQLGQINRAFAELVRIKDAAGRIGAQEGVFSPAQMLSAVRAGDSSLRRGRFAEGRALGQELAEDAKTVLGTTVPDSGTPFRLANMLLLGAGGMVNPAIPAGAAVATAPFTPVGQRLGAALVSQRPPSAAAVAEMLRRLGPAATAATMANQ